MKTLQILLLEDQMEEAKLLINTLENNNYKVTHVRNLEKAKKEVQQVMYDLILLDIMIDGNPDGITFANYIYESGFEVPFLFLTSMRSKVVFEKAKLTKPYTYLLKPYNELELLFSIELAIEKQYEQSNTISFKKENAVLGPLFLFVKKGKHVAKIEVASIDYIEVTGKYCDLACTEGNYLIKLSLKKVITLLSNPNFIQVHRNFLVNLKKIKEIYFEDNLILLESKAKIPFSERYKASFSKNNIIFR